MDDAGIINRVFSKDTKERPPPRKDEFIRTFSFFTMGTYNDVVRNVVHILAEDFQFDEHQLMNDVSYQREKSGHFNVRMKVRVTGHDLPSNAFARLGFFKIVLARVQSIGNGEYEVHSDNDCSTFIVGMPEDRFDYFRRISLYGSDHHDWKKMQRALRKMISFGVSAQEARELGISGDDINALLDAITSREQYHKDLDDLKTIHRFRRDRNGRVRQVQEDGTENP